VLLTSEDWSQLDTFILVSIIKALDGLALIHFSIFGIFLDSRREGKVLLAAPTVFSRLRSVLTICRDEWRSAFEGAQSVLVSVLLDHHA